LVADDATILDPRQCQVEAWTERHPSVHEYWAVPHCNFGGDWELAAGSGELRSTPGHRSSAWGFAMAKTVFRPLKPNDWSAGLVLAGQFGGGSGLFGDVSVNVPLSFSLLDDRLRLHANAGWIRQRDDRSGATWALASEWKIRHGLFATVEAYGNGRAYFQAGVRYALLPQRLIVDAAAGDRLSLRGKERYYAIGLTVTGLGWR
jgi:hypothetical protein